MCEDVIILIHMKHKYIMKIVILHHLIQKTYKFYIEVLYQEVQHNIWSSLLPFTMMHFFEL